MNTAKNFEKLTKRDQTFAEAYLSKVKNAWKPKEKAILAYMEQLTGLSWKRKEIVCYALKTSRTYPFSDPLTIPIQYRRKHRVVTISVDEFIDTLVHELIHNLFIDNTTETKNYFDYLIKKKYKSYSFNTAIHVPVHAIHKKIFEKFFSKARLEKEIRFFKNFPDYKNSWQIVLNGGSDNLFRELRKMTK